MYEQLLKDKYILRDENIIREIKIGQMLDVSSSISAKAFVVKDSSDLRQLQIVIIDMRFSTTEPEIFAPKFACFQYDKKETTWLAQVVTGIIARAMTLSNNKSKKELKKRFSSLVDLAGIQL